MRNMPILAVILIFFSTIVAVLFGPPMVAQNRERHFDCLRHLEHEAMLKTLPLDVDTAWALANAHDGIRRHCTDDDVQKGW